MPNYRVEDQSKNGVRVLVTLWESGGRTVEADCQCFGHPKRVHSREDCPLRLKQLLASFTVGQRVQLHPATDLWMRGARYGDVERVGSRRVHVRLDRMPGRTVAFAPTDVLPV